MMSTLEIWLLAVALAIDCFMMSLACGISLKTIRWNTILSIGLFFGGFQALMPLLGWAATDSFYQYLQAYDHWIAFVLLCLLGIGLIREYITPEEAFSLNPLRIEVQIVMALATSLDALTVGISFTAVGYHQIETLLYPLSIIALASLVFSITGHLIGAVFGNKFHIKIELLGGIIFIGFAFKILIEHLYFNH